MIRQQLWRKTSAENAALQIVQEEETNGSG